MSWTVEWTNASPGWNIDSAESYGNAQEAYNYLISSGYTRNAAIGVLANLYAESQINPGQWQIGGSIYGSGTGFGIGQWTPWTNFSNYIGSQDQSAMSNGSSQMRYLVSNTAQWGHQRVDSSGWSSYYNLQTIYFAGMSDYAKSTASPEELAVAWMTQWERPGAAGAHTSTRRSNASWYDAHISGGGSVGYYNVYITIDGNGSAYSVPTSGEQGDTITLYETPNGSDTFTGWEVTSGSATIVNNQFTMPATDVYITAHFTGETPEIPSEEHIVIFINDSHIATWAEPPGGVAGTLITLNYVNHGNDRWQGWEVIFPEGLEITDNTLTMPDSNVIILVKYKTWFVSTKPSWILNSGQ